MTLIEDCLNNPKKVLDLLEVNDRGEIFIDCSKHPEECLSLLIEDVDHRKIMINLSLEALEEIKCQITYFSMSCPCLESAVALINRTPYIDENLAMRLIALSPITIKFLNQTHDLCLYAMSLANVSRYVEDITYELDCLARKLYGPLYRPIDMATTDIPEENIIQALEKNGPLINDITNPTKKMLLVASKTTTLIRTIDDKTSYLRRIIDGTDEELCFQLLTNSPALYLDMIDPTPKVAEMAIKLRPANIREIKTWTKELVDVTLDYYPAFIDAVDASFITYEQACEIVAKNSQLLGHIPKHLIDEKLVRLAMDNNTPCFRVVSKYATYDDYVTMVSRDNYQGLLIHSDNVSKEEYESLARTIISKDVSQIQFLRQDMCVDHFDFCVSKVRKQPMCMDYLCEQSEELTEELLGIHPQAFTMLKLPDRIIREYLDKEPKNVSIMKSMTHDHWKYAINKDVSLIREFFNKEGCDYKMIRYAASLSV